MSNGASETSSRAPSRADSDGKTRIKTARNSNYLKSARESTGYLEIRCGSTPEAFSRASAYIMQSITRLMQVRRALTR